MIDEVLQAGVDIGSTTAKMAVLRGKDVIYSDYRRHNADVVETLRQMIGDALEELGPVMISVSVTGSAGLGISERFDIPFVQEVIASAETVRELYPDVRTLIDVGGEDSKMIFFDDRMRPDIRMNGNCAGGTVAFIDQMATLLDVPIEDLETLARSHKDLHHMASRCGVFAKTDVQNLLSREISKEDISASIFHAVAVQVLSTLSRGVEPKPMVMFCGGPFTYLPFLKDSFINVMGIEGSNVVNPDHSDLIPAIGTALHRDIKRLEMTLEGFHDMLKSGGSRRIELSKRLDPLFSGKEEFLEWEGRRMTPIKQTVSIEELDGKVCFLGVDSGSTTTKVVLIDDQGNMAYRFYSNNKGDPIGAVKRGLEGLSDQLENSGVKIEIRGSSVTGYGEDLIKAAYGIDIGMVETLAHFRAAREFLSDVSFILDIGGQDMKAIFITEGVINNIEINEACSSGCGSFIETFAMSLGHEVADFARLACDSEAPCDLGTRCTVFMNSKVKQSQREGASVGDISAGLAFSVIKNCLYKVLKIKDISVLGDSIVVQGGTFRNPAVHRAFELILGKRVICSDVPEQMGAYGAALRAMDVSSDEPSTFIGLDQLVQAKDYTKKYIRCQGCENNCMVTRLTFRNGEIFFTGNKCERIFTNRGSTIRIGENIPDIKLGMLLDREMVPEGKPKLRIGIPRVLNLFENFPFWNTLMVGAGFEVVLSPGSHEGLNEKGSKTIMSENICFPAKLANGHIIELMEKGVDRILYPMVIFEGVEYGDSLNTFNCPIVSGYPDVIRSAIDPEGKHAVPFDTPPVTFEDIGLLKRSCWKYLKSLGVDKRTFLRAFDDAVKEQSRYKVDLRKRARVVLDEAEQEGRLVVLLLGRPYHIDPLINHKIPEMIAQLGADVITEDSIPHKGDEDLSNIQVLTQWSYPNRIYNAVNWARDKDNVEVVQLNSFGCGPDAMVCDEARVILAEVGKNHTLIRIDEVSSPGSVKLRLRSMLESLYLRGIGSRSHPVERRTTPTYRMKDRRRKIIVPSFSPFFDPLIVAAFADQGYELETLPPPDRESVNVGLKYANNDICYPATIVIGDIIKGLQSGRYDIENTAVGITQTGGQCRASSYLSLLKKALVAAGFEEVPVITVTTSSKQLNYQPGLKMDMRRLTKMGLFALMYSDSLMMMYYSTAVREKNKGDTWALVDKYLKKACGSLESGRTEDLLGSLTEAVGEFNRLEVNEGEYPLVGYVGEIYVKYSPFGNMFLVDWMEENGVEVLVPSMFEFFSQYYLNDRFLVDHDVKRRNLFYFLTYPAEWYVKFHMGKFERVRKRYSRYRVSHDPRHLSEIASKAVTLVDQFGEGWLIPAEIISFMDYGIKNVLCVQPFGCIANHVIGKGVEKRLKDINPDMNILYLDMDAGSSEVNLLNRLNFLVKAAKVDMELDG